MIRSILHKLSGLYFGWRMIAVSCTIRVLGGGLHAYGLSVFFLPVSQELNLSRTSASLVFSLARAQGALEGPLAGYCIDRYGPRPVVTVAVILAGIGYLLLSEVHSFTALLIVYMGIISLSYQAGFMDATMAIANTWFIRKRALAMSLTSGSIALGGALLTPFLAYAVHNWGWRTAAIGAGLVFLVSGLPLALTLRRSPESLGLLPDGEPARTINNEGREPTPSSPPLSDRELSLAETLRTRQFWILALATTLRVVCSSGVLVHLVPILVWQGYSQPQAAFYLGVIAFFGMPAHLLIGWLGDRIDKPRLMAFCMGLGSVALYGLFLGTHKWQLWIALALFTLFEGLFPVTWATVGDFFGRQNFGKIRGSMSVLYTWGSVLGPVLAGAIYDRTHSYAALFWLLFALSWITALLYLSLSAPQRRGAKISPLVMNLGAPCSWSQTAKSWGPAIGWMALIFWFSTDNFSSSNTTPLFSSLLTGFIPGVTPEQIEALHLLLRKLGHWSEYFILAVLVWRSQIGSNLGSRPTATAAFVFLFALSDEWHQAFVPSRSASFADVLLDTLGGICGVLFMRLRHRLTHRKSPS